MCTLGEWTDRDYWVWLLSIPGLYRMNLMVLLQYFGSPRAIFEAEDGELAVFERYGMKWIRKLKAGKNAGQAERAARKMKDCGVRLVISTDADWPAALNQIADPPYGLFCRGELPASDIYTIAVVGARSCTAYGRNMAMEIGRAAAHAGIQVVSGMALGIDGFAQTVCLQEGGKSFSVLGCGVEECYPREHIELYTQLCRSGGILSEFPCETPPLRQHFPMRNRLISGLSDAVIVVEAREKSGSLITADQALDQGRDIYAVPGRSGDILSGGCNGLIAHGAAGIVLTVEQLISELKEAAQIKGKSLLSASETMKIQGIIRKNDTDGRNRFIKTALAPDEELVYSLLDLSPEGFEKLQQMTEMNMPRLSAALAGLVMKGLAEEIGQNQYMKR